MRARATDEWFESEESPRHAMIAEVQRIQRRTRARFLPVLVVATLITTGVTYRLSTAKANVEAEVVLSLSEGSLSGKHSGIPVDELREYVSNTLLPDAKLLELIEHHNLYPQRVRFGNQFAIDSLREQLEIQIWKNTFVYYDEDAENAEHSAHIGLTVTDTDSDRAFELARALASIVIESTQAQRQLLSKNLAQEIAAVRKRLTERVDRLDHEVSQKQVALDDARKAHKQSLAQSIELELAEVQYERRAGSKSLKEIASSRDAIAEQISTAGLDMTVQVVEEHRPEHSEHHGFVTVLIAAVLAIGSLLGSALVLGAFDSRVHDLDDVERLGLPVLGHLPGFPGDEVGSLATRGIGRRRVPSFLRWVSHR